MKDDELHEIYKRLSTKHRNQLNSFYQLRTLFGPIIEGLILLDRVVYLLEQDSTYEAHLIRLFDPVISPRCYGIIALKH